VVTVTGVNDAVVDGNVVATVVLTINTGSTQDSNYDTLNPADVTVTNSDNDAVGVTVTPTSGHATNEGGSVSTFIVVLNTAPDGDVVIDLAVSDVSEIDIDLNSLTFTTADWSTPQQVTITGLNDGIADGNQSVLVTITVNAAATGDMTGYDGVNPPDVAVTNNDDDAAAVTVNPTTTRATPVAMATPTRCRRTNFRAR